jgi:hypothetical protein
MERHAKESLAWYLLRAGKIDKRRGDRLLQYQFSRQEIARHKCIACSVNVIEIGDYSMLQPDLWKQQLGLIWTDNLCIKCIETRLGRRLSFVDFCTVVTVAGYSPSDILVDRLELTRQKRKTRRKRAAA